MIKLVAIFIGGGLGSICRYGISRFSNQWISASWPWGTFISNILACVLLAAVILYLSGKEVEDNIWRLFLITGFCGGFSTFSTYSYETFALFKQGNFLIAAANVLVSVMVGFAVIYLLLRNQV